MTRARTRADGAGGHSGGRAALAARRTWMHAALIRAIASARALERRARVALPLALALCGGCVEPEAPRRHDPPLKLLPAPAGALAATLTAAPRRYAIDLSSTLALAGAGSFEIALARERTNELAARSLRAGEVFIPSLNPVAAARAHDGIVQRSTGQFVTDVDKQQVSGGLVGSVRFDLAGSILEALAASQRETAARAAAVATRNDVLLAAAHGYFRLVGRRARVGVARTAVLEGRELLKVQEGKYAQGGGGPQGGGLKVDVLRAKAELAREEQALVDAEAAERATSIELATILGLDPTAVLVPFESRPELVSFVRDTEREGELIREALERRPEIAEARALLRAAAHDESAATFGPALPSLEGDVSVGGLGPHPDVTRESDDYAAFVGWRIGPGGLFDVGAIREARSRRSQARLRLERLENQVAAEVAGARLAEQAARARVDTAREGVAAAEGALSLSRERVREGVAIILEQLDAERVYTLAQELEIEAIVEFDRAAYALERAVGEPPMSRK